MRNEIVGRSRGEKKYQKMCLYSLLRQQGVARLLTWIEYFFPKSDAKSSMEVLAPIPVDTEKRLTRRKSSHHMLDDYGEDKENLLSREDHRLENHVFMDLKSGGKRIKKGFVEKRVEYLEHNLRFQCETCRNPIYSEHEIFCMMDKHFCSYECRSLFFQNENKFVNKVRMMR
jgi:hypothetical protein